MLENQGVKLPNDFDVNQLKGAPKKIEVNSQIIDPLNALTHQMQNLQQ